MEKKARSRLKTLPAEKEPVDFMPKGERKTNQKSLKYVKKYFQHISTFIVATFIYFLLLVFVNLVDPNQVEDFLLANSYLPFLILLSIANFFLFSFIFLNSKRGLFYSGLISALVFLNFQSVVLTMPTIFFFIFVIAVFEGINLVLGKLVKH